MLRAYKNLHIIFKCIPPIKCFTCNFYIQPDETLSNGWKLNEENRLPSKESCLVGRFSVCNRFDQQVTTRDISANEKGNIVYTLVRTCVHQPMDMVVILIDIILNMDTWIQPKESRTRLFFPNVCFSNSQLISEKH